MKEKGKDKKTGKILVVLDPRCHHPMGVDYLRESLQDKQNLGCSAKTKFKDLVVLMTNADLDKVKKKGFLITSGHWSSSSATYEMGGKECDTRA